MNFWLSKQAITFGTITVPLTKEGQSSRFASVITCYWIVSFDSHSKCHWSLSLGTAVSTCFLVPCCVATTQLTCGTDTAMLRFYHCVCPVFLFLWFWWDVRILTNAAPAVGVAQSVHIIVKSGKAMPTLLTCSATHSRHYF